MRRVQQRASLDERSVQAVARGEADLPRRTRRQVESHRARTYKTVKVDERVLRQAKRLSRGKYVLQIESPTSVLVTNRMRNIG